jgi:tyrosine-protein phosphatase-like protein OCA2
MIVYGSSGEGADGRYCADQDYSAENIEWCQQHGIEVRHVLMQSAKEPFLENDPKLVAETLSYLLDSRNYPLLIHSNKGKHRWQDPAERALTCSGVVIGCLRRLQGWSLASIFNEYDRYAQGKGEGDLQFIEAFDTKIDYDTQHKPAWMP